jgi:S-DNA-T family DNA segregation ATPase FtsK/SpoIIIE
MALAALGAAVFLGFVLVAGRRGGFVGEGAESFLRVLLGRLSYLVPVALAALAASLIFEFRPRLSSAWLLGLVLGMVGLALLVASGFSPLGPGHEAQLFVREVYRDRAGWTGEVLYAGGVRVAGGVGVATAAWILLVGGISLVTGLTIRRAVTGTHRAAVRAKEGAERTTRQIREREHVAAPETGPLDDPYLAGFGSSAPDQSARPFFEGEPGSTDDEYPPFDPEAPTLAQSRAREQEVLDGAAAFPDLYGGGGDGGVPPRIIPANGVAPGVSETVGAGSSEGHETLRRADARKEGDEAGGGATVANQESLPGLEGVDASGERSYVLPSADLLKRSSVPKVTDGRGDRETAALLVQTLSHFGVDATVVGMVVGPRVTRYELQLAPGTKVSKVAGLKDDLAYSLASTEIRILAPIPGKQAVGVEVPNQRPSFVTLGDIYRDFPRSAGPLMVWLGKDISGKPVYTDLAKLPHLLIAGTTGSGKSGCVNCIISSILLRASPDQVKMILIDPKKVELSHYDFIPHLLVPVVTNMKNAAGVLHNVVKEMENRYELMELDRSRNLDEVNRVRLRRGERALPHVVIVIDELADLMMVSPADVEEYIIRLAQKARAVGIHLVVATQRPSVDVITGMIKANFPSRIAFAVSSQTDSRVILDQNGAEALLGMGDMLFKPLGSTRLQRIQGAYITEEEIHLLVTHVRHQARPEYREELLEAPTRDTAGDEGLFDRDSDDLLEDAAAIVLETGSASVSMLQRRLRVGYTRAGRLIDMLERRGIVGPYEGSKSRQILVRSEERDRVMEELRPHHFEAPPLDWDEPEE